MSATTLPLFTSIDAASSQFPVGHTLISVVWKNTVKQTGKERHVAIPSIYLTAADCPSAYRALVESVLLRTAEAVIKNFVNSEGDAISEIPEYLLQKTSLIEAATGSALSAWPEADEWDELFTSSETWKIIAGRTEFRTNPVYRRKADQFKQLMLRLQGKKTRHSPEIAEVLLSKIAESDLETPFGVFAVKRLQGMMTAASIADDLSGL